MARPEQFADSSGMPMRRSSVVSCLSTRLTNTDIPLSRHGLMLVS